MADENEPPFFDDCDIEVVDFDPHLGLLTIKTERGAHMMFVTRPAAAIIINELVDFMATEPVSPDEAKKMD